MSPETNQRMTGKNCLVTGSTRGIGFHETNQRSESHVRVQGCSSQESDLSPYLAIAIPFLILRCTSANPAFLVIGFIIFIIGLSEEEGEQDQKS
jgi:hypothetical protein